MASKDTTSGLIGRSMLSCGVAFRQGLSSKVDGARARVVEKPRPNATAPEAAGRPGPIPARARRDLRSRLLAWYDRHRRDLPWRGARDPYLVWVSEVMLQQTQVATVLRYFPAFIRRFPSVQALARAPEDEVLHAWQGLGYYSRARRLQAGARAVVERHAGELPSDHAQLLELPGIGAYSAGAIASIAFGEPKPLVDGNVVRVLARRFGLRGDPAKRPLQKALWELAGALVPAERPGDFNQALMELGATVCTPRAPSCDACPLALGCVARREGSVEALPEIAARPKPTRVRAVAVAVRNADRVLLVRLPASAPRWAGLWTFPHVELARGETPRAGAERAAREHAGTEVRLGRRLTRIEHTITRFRIALELFEAAPATPRLRFGSRSSRLVFAAPSELSGLAMPTPHRALAETLFRGEGR
jgi:A/G-specific adenine glycosylase